MRYVGFAIFLLVLITAVISTVAYFSWEASTKVVEASAIEVPQRIGISKDTNTHYSVMRWDPKANAWRIRMGPLVEDSKLKECDPIQR